MAQREQDILRVDARDKVTGRTKYAADLVFDGILYTKSVHADLPHGKLLAVHTAAALAAEGVAGVYTARDIPGRNVGDNEKPIMVYDTIRSRGDCIAVVAAVSQEAADRAARLVTYDAQPMPAVFDPEEALLPDAPKLYDDGNLILEHRVRKGRAAQGFDEADIIVEREFRTQRVIPGAIEPESVVVSPQDGELRVYCPCKAPFNIRRIVAAACGLPMSAVRVTQPGMGGSFGGKDDDAGAMAARAAIAALHTGRPCRMTWRSSETLLEGVKRHPFHIYYKAGAKRDGTLTAIEVRGFVDGGAYLSKSKTTTWRSGIEATGPYRVEHVDVCMKAAYTNNCYAGKDSMEVIMEETEKKMFQLLGQRNSGDFMPIRQVVINTLENIERASKTKGNVTGIPTGFTDLDYKTSGLQNSDFILIAARPSMGKTAFVLNIAQYMAFKKDKAVAIFSLEMSREQLMNRLLSMESKVDSQHLRTGNLKDDEWSKLIESAGMIGESRLMIDDTPGISIGEMRSKCRKYKLEHGLDIIIIDYLQLMSGSGKSSSESRQQEISDISRSLKALARELNVPVVALSQLSRAVEQRTDHRPMLSDLRESGAIEQDADVVMFIYRDDYYNKDSENKGIAEIIIAKQRNGPIGTVNLVWLPDYTKFANAER